MSREYGYSNTTDKHKIRRLLVCPPKPVGYTTLRISEKLGIPLYRTRRALKELCKEPGEIFWFAEWYGCNAGYRRIYRKKHADQLLTNLACQYRDHHLVADKIFPKKESND